MIHNENELNTNNSINLQKNEKIDKNIFRLQNNQNNFRRLPVQMKQQIRVKNYNKSTLLQNGLNLLNSNAPNVKGHFRCYSIMENPNSKYTDNYLMRLDNLKEKFDSPQKIINNKSLNSGFKYYEIPRINKSERSSNYRINELHDTIGKSIKYYYPKDQKIEDLANKENERLNDYVKNLNFLNFEGSNDTIKKYPNLVDFQNLEKMRLNKLKVGGNKCMGNRYDSNI